MADWEVIIGLEIHAELLTESKVFCGCNTEFGGEPNSQVCPVCMGLPGALPVLNRQAVELAIKAGLALNCTINGTSQFDRKHYFYPDLPKAYQISQNDRPLCSHGMVELSVGDRKRQIGIQRVHLEEEAGKSVHVGDSIISSEYSLLDYNRSGIALVEIVTEPDIRSAEEARLFLEKLKTLLEYTEVSDCKMEEGSLRCDANISLRPKGSSAYGVKTEIKNLNSFRAVQRALEFEADRQRRLLQAKEVVLPETRHWDEAKGMTFSMRSKAKAADYRYMPDPNLYPLQVDEAWIESIRQNLPELPDAKRDRFINDYDLPPYDADVLTTSRHLADYFEACVQEVDEPKLVSNWVMGEVLRWLKAHELEIESSPVAPKELGGLLKLIQEDVVSTIVAKDVLSEMFATGKSAVEIVDEKGWRQISDADSLEAIIDGVIAENPGPVADFQKGKTKAIGFLVGQVMKASKGQANPQKANEMLRQKLQK
ncbi:MAG: Asp-tRNA(Asn)/Glu-tRNA(Gln) amidotransferase subunit GatB [Firmicutes bacterium]|nr:Asp-tRNA(Asn)/Glu-tRNA(Gln) amidotransferase subunit GatB [Bacillota bacterium]